MLVQTFPDIRRPSITLYNMKEEEKHIFYCFFVFLESFFFDYI